MDTNITSLKTNVISMSSITKTDTNAIEAVKFNDTSKIEEEDVTDFDDVGGDVDNISATDSDTFDSTDDTSVESTSIIHKMVNDRNTNTSFEDNITTGENRSELSSSAIIQFDDLLTKIEDLNTTFSMLSDSSVSMSSITKIDTDAIEAVNFNDISKIEEEDVTDFDDVGGDVDSISATDSDTFDSTDDTSVESTSIIHKMVNDRNTNTNFEDNSTTGENRSELSSSAIIQFDDLLTKIEDLNTTFSMLSDSSVSMSSITKTDTDTIEAVNFSDSIIIEEEDVTDFDKVVKDVDNISATDSDTFDSTDDTSVESTSIIHKMVNDRNTNTNFEDNSTTGENRSELSSNEIAEFDDLLTKIEELSTTFSMLSDSSVDTNVDSVSTIQNSDIEENEAIVEANNQEDYTDIEIATDFKGYERYTQCLANEHLSFKKVEKCSPCATLTQHKSNRHEDNLEKKIKLNNNSKSVLSPGKEKQNIDQRPPTLIKSPFRQEVESMKSIFSSNSSTDCVKSGKRPKTVTWSSSTDVKDNKPVLDPNKNMTSKKKSISEIAGFRLHLKAMERKKRLALLRGGYKTCQSKLIDTDRSSKNLFCGVKKKKGVMFNVDSNRSTSQRQLSKSEIAGQRLHLKAMERNKRLAILRKEYHTHKSKLVLKNVSKSMGCDIKSFKHDLTGVKLNQYNPLNTTEANKDPNSASSMIQTEDIRFNMDPYNNSIQKKSSFSDINRFSLYSKSAERNQRSRLFRKESCKHQPKFILETILENRGTDTKSSKCDSTQVDHKIMEGTLPFSTKEMEQAKKKIMRQAEQIRQLKLKLKNVNILKHDRKGRATKNSTDTVTRNINNTKDEHQVNTISKLLPKNTSNNFSPSMFQTNDGRSKRSLSFSEIAGYRLYTKAMERNERLALRRKESHNHQPKLILATASESRPNNIKCGSKFRRL